MNGWISVDERSPPNEEQVLAVDEYGITYRIAWLLHGCWYATDWDNPYYSPDIAYWMPLPNPPTDREPKTIASTAGTDPWTP